MDAQDALQRLMDGNERFLSLAANEGDVSVALRSELANNGQHPFAVVIACSDSRVVPEHLFNCGLGEIFCIRTAGNTIGEGELASAVYACDHLGCKLLVVLGHTCCGAVAATLEGGAHGAVAPLTDRIRHAIGDEQDPTTASWVNAKHGVQVLMDNPEIAELVEQGLMLKAALHHIETGEVEFADE